MALRWRRTSLLLRLAKVLSVVNDPRFTNMATAATIIDAHCYSLYAFLSYHYAVLAFTICTNPLSSPPPSKLQHLARRSFAFHATSCASHKSSYLRIIADPLLSRATRLVTYHRASMTPPTLIASRHQDLDRRLQNARRRSSGSATTAVMVPWPTNTIPTATNVFIGVVRTAQSKW